jgi:DNA-binding NtrC family response regulator
MGGEIKVNSREGEGSVFLFTLPFKPVGKRHSTPAEEQADRRGAPLPDVHILLAEDDPAIRKMVLVSLARNGWKTETAENGREAVQKWAEGNFDLILMDLQMPEMDGLQATMKIRETEAYRQNGTGICIIGLTAHARQEVKNECLKAGMDQVLIKPVQIKELLSVVERCISDKLDQAAANARQMGRFELADGGTIFLDEIGEMPLELQCKLLRVLQDGEFERLGNPRTIKVNVRIIAASNRNLEEEIRAGRFRVDLFYRLSVFPITIPPLRQRKEDIPLLVQYFVGKFNKKIGKKIETVSKGTLSALQEYHWPGNVRELENVIERAVITSQGPVLQVLDRFDTFRDPGSEQDIKALADLERDHILQVLQKTGWRIEGEKGAATILGLNPSTLRARMRKCGLRRH